MKEKFEFALKREDPEECFLNNLVEKFNDEQVPLKIRKINLLEAIDLPIPKTDIISRKNELEIKEKISTRLRESNEPLIMRFSGHDDKLGMPSFYIDDEKNLVDVLRRMKDIFTRDLNISHVILQSATPNEEIHNKISGRLMISDDMNDEIIELYKGARSTGVLNSVNQSDIQFYRLIKPAGGFMRPEKKIDPNSTLNTGEVIDMIRKIDEKRDAIEIARSVLHNSKRHNRNDYTFEFSYRNGNLVFTDID